MNLLNSVMPKYSYNYFDSYNQLQTKQLNIFQCFVRRAFGCYAETHLSNVAQIAYTVTLKDQFQAAPRKQQELLKLIAKAKNVYGFRRSYINLPACNLSTGTKVNISLRYDIRKPEDATGNFKISSIDFNLIFSRNNHVQKNLNISIFKNKSQRTVVYLPFGLFQGNSDDSEDSIKNRLNSEYVKTISDLLAKILNDSSTSCEMDEVQYCADDYRYMYYGLSSKSQPSTDDLNSMQDKAMSQLGWEYLNQFKDPRGVVEKRVYIHRKEAAAKNQNLAALGFNQQLSTAFAASFLETTREY